ncbi:hypothetical protein YASMINEVIRUS_1033 [Yasminevirus sp. GU-2018]|uniref:Uncharacterized protein n=1 Tax=Yasminevirus sp. GU-2018 TaxID=2420051 RepID=A0A5K0UA45_9VIRU|nr:hypothetical protein YASMINEVIRUS_1033 [Yasminevirus sp. GU-2018]
MSYLKFSPDLSVSTVAELQKLATQFIETVGISDSHLDRLNSTFEEIVQSISKIIFGTSLDKETLLRLVKALVTVSQISTFPVEIWESNGKAQYPKTSCLADILAKTLANNFHTVEDECQSFDAKTSSCKFNNPFIPDTHRHKFVCDFHLHDSVSVHLVLACIHNGVWAIHNHHDDRIIMKACLFGLYHDVGKPLSVETYEFKNSVITGFPAHAEVGAMMFISHFTPDMERLISKDDYMTVSQAILRHMCGYHGDQNVSNSYKRALLMVEQEDVRQLLTFNRVGDHFGKLVDKKEESAGVQETEHFLAEQALFEKQMRSDEPFDLSKVLSSSRNKSGSIRPDKIAVYMIGTSGAGKTYLLRELMRMFPNSVTYISRDECIAEVCVGKRARLEGEEYVRMYKIYESGKAVSAFCRKITSNKKLDKRESAEFESAKNALVQAQTEWNKFIETLPSERSRFFAISVFDEKTFEKVSNIPNIPGQVQALYDSRIKNALADDRLFLVMDTFMNCFPMAVEANVPSELSKCFRVHIHVQAYVERKTTSVATSLDAQLKLSGPYGLDNPLHPDGFKNGKNKKAFASLSSEIGTDGPLPRSTFTTKFRPHLVYVCTRTPTGNYGYDELFSGLRNLCSCYSITCATEGKKIEKSDEVVESTESAESFDEKTELATGAPSASSGLAEDDVDDLFGVDPATKDMNVLEIYRHLMDTYSGDRTQIREFLRTLNGSIPGKNGFMHNSVIEKSFDAMDEKERTVYCSALAKLSVDWCINGVISKSHTADEFASSPDTREKFVHSLVVLKYFEQYGARFWQNVWAKEMRGTTLFISPEDGSVKILSLKLLRGAEAVTGMVSKNNLETQDVKPGKIKILDEEQKDTCTRLCSNSPIKMHLTSKGDGSLMIVNAYTGSALKIMLPVVMNFGSNYVRIWASQSLKLTEGKRLLVPATQGTLMEGGFMSAYMVTALLVGSNIVSREELTAMEKEGATCEDAWEKYGEAWMKKFLKFKFYDELTETHTFSFEAICKNRCGLFGDGPHVELACSYARDRLIFLGVTLADCRFYIPHSLYSAVSDIPFEQPLWWDIDHATQVNQMIDEINKMILNKMSKEAFLKMFPPSNKGFDPRLPEHVADAIIDFEGWVAMKFATFEVKDLDHLKVVEALKIPVTIYSKIKTEAYYRSHKFREENINYLVELSKTAGHIFPLSFKVAGICRHGVIADRLAEVGRRTMALLDFKDPHNAIIPTLHTAFARTMSEVQKRVDAGETVKIPKNPLTGFEKRPFDVQCRMALNFDGFDFGDLLVPIYLEIFPEIDPNTADLKGTLRGLTLNLQPWTKGYDERIKDLNPRSSAVQGLVAACIGSSVI